jgi:hypothetical protein
VQELRLLVKDVKRIGIGRTLRRGTSRAKKPNWKQKNRDRSQADRHLVKSSSTEPDGSVTTILWAEAGSHGKSRNEFGLPIWAEQIIALQRKERREKSGGVDVEF